MDKLYERINWENSPSTKTPINDTNLNKMDKGIDDLDKRIVEEIPAMDTQNNVITFESQDALDSEENPLAWTDVELLTTGEKHSSILKKISTMFKNVRYLFKMLGTADISAIGDGTVTGGLAQLNNNKIGCINVSKKLYEITDENAIDGSLHVLWTATEDCWCSIDGKAYANNSYAASIYLNGVRVAIFYGEQTSSVIFPVKKGQTVTKGNGFVTAYFYGMS